MTSHQLSAWEATHQTIAQHYHSNKDVRIVICPTSYYQFRSSYNFTAFPSTFGKCNARPVSFVPLPNANEDFSKSDLIAPLLKQGSWVIPYDSFERRILVFRWVSKESYGITQDPCFNKGAMRSDLEKSC
ncbi:hypothetical protein C1H46_042143 [Malus baccata]|uniref:Uncharacterized protein n=1 Tax=Malus baccata TaxID=106549 RepID=A0A540KDQ9_MALBA|nr:hypothetical protein C1H46_042143 [Malus baccata]